MKRSRPLDRSRSSTSREQRKAKKVRVMTQKPLDNEGYPILLFSNMQVHKPTADFINSQLRVRSNRMDDGGGCLSLVPYDPKISFLQKIVNEVKAWD